MNTRSWSCANHPGIYACREHDGKWICWSCFKALPETRKRPAMFNERAFATGLGPQAHAEAREAKRYQDDYDRAKAYMRERKL